MSTYEDLLDIFCIWTRGLTSNEINKIYAQGLEGIPASNQIISE
ncbi:hypothetical protein [Urechidicola sp. KH5]